MTVFGRHARRLRQLAHAHEVIRVQLTHAVNQIVAVPRPVRTGRRVPNVMRHGRRARREDGDVGAALALQLELRAFQTFPDLVVADLDFAVVGRLRRILQRRDLRIAIFLERLGRGGVVAVTIDNHESSSLQKSVQRLHDFAAHNRRTVRRKLLRELMPVLPELPEEAIKVPHRAVGKIVQNHQAPFTRAAVG